MNVILLWDYYDQLALHGRPYGPTEMRKLCHRAKQAGVTALCFRVEGAGMAWVPSNVRPVYRRYDPDHALNWVDFSRLKITPEQHRERSTIAAYFDKLYETCPDPLEAACEAARREGLAIHVYICPQDQYWPGVRDTLVEARPDACIASRDGTSRLAIPSLADDANRQWLLNFYDEVLKHDVDDVVIYPNTHAWYSFPCDAPDDWFGFEEPSVRSYVDQGNPPPNDAGFDIDHYYHHYGTYWTQLVDALAERQRRRNRRVIVGMDCGPWQVHLPWAAPRLMTTFRRANDWQAWTAHRNVEVCAGFQTNMWTYEGWPANQLACMPGSPERPPYQHIEELFAGSTTPWAFLTLHADQAAVELARAFEESTQYGYAGLIIREAADFEFTLGWDGLAEQIRRYGA